MDVLGYTKLTLNDFIDKYRSFLRQPSISAKNIGVNECALFLRDLMEDLGMYADVVQSRGNPLVYGEVKSQESDKTLLIYSHYDVQPPDPLNEWIYPPFEAKMVDGKIVARGASDAKGNIMAFLKAAEYYVKNEKSTPVNVKFLFEGEEEIGSPNLPDFVEAHKDLLKADAVVCWDGGLHPSNRPAICLGVKGILYVELKCKTAKIDVHSSYAPIVANPAWRLVWALNSIKSPDGRIKIEGWYDDVRPITLEEAKLISELPPEDEEIVKELGIRELLGGVKGVNALRKLICEPTANIAGLKSGYIEEGSKTVLPCEATAKLDFRLIVDQKPDRLLDLLRKHLNAEGFRDIEIVKLGSLLPSKTPPSASIVKASSYAAEEAYKVKPILYPNATGSGPDYVFTGILYLESVWTGCAPPFSKAHAPNEFNTVDHLIKGVLYATNILREFKVLN
ncbi:M20/M25/M40 family metallo-hydrolase [Candidatus Bathyarchaeota archaeon]|nr:M20/M25/M40 family metallo-hydrolase [Candidatus Bathyarchaeota archaeon]